MSYSMPTGRRSRVTSLTSVRSTMHTSTLRHSNKEVWRSPTFFQNLKCSLTWLGILSGIHLLLKMNHNQHSSLKLSRPCLNDLSTPSSSTVPIDELLWGDKDACNLRRCYVQEAMSTQGYTGYFNPSYYYDHNYHHDKKEPHSVRRADCAGKGSAQNGLMGHQHILTHTHTHRCKH